MVGKMSEAARASAEKAVNEGHMARAAAETADQISAGKAQGYVAAARERMAVAAATAAAAAAAKEEASDAAISASAAVEAGEEASWKKLGRHVSTRMALGAFGDMRALMEAAAKAEREAEELEEEGGEEEAEAHPLDHLPAEAAAEAPTAAPPAAELASLDVSPAPAPPPPAAPPPPPPQPASIGSVAVLRDETITLNLRWQPRQVQLQLVGVRSPPVAPKEAAVAGGAATKDQGSGAAFNSGGEGEGGAGEDGTTSVTAGEEVKVLMDAEGSVQASAVGFHPRLFSPEPPCLLQ